MTGFEELVERARASLAGAEGAGQGAPSPLTDEGPRLEAYLATRERFRAELGKLMEGIEGNARMFDLKADEATTPLRRWLARLLDRLLRIGGLGKHLGANQLRANQATLGALRLLQGRMLEQDRALEELAADLAEQGRSSRGQGEPR